MIEKIQQYAKFLVAVVGAVATAGTTFIPADWQPYISFAVAILTGIATYAVPNKGAATDVLVQGDGLADGAPKHQA